MKKNTLLLALLAGGTTLAQAQNTVQAGIKTGLSVAVLDGTINTGANYKSGLHVGGMLRWRPTARVAFQPELTFSQQGANSEVPAGPVTLESKIKLSYLNLPLLLKVYLGKVVNLQVGPQFGLLLSGRQVGQTGYYTGSGGSGYRTADLDVTESYKSDVAGCLGLGADLKNGLVLAARANYGFTNINNSEQEQKFRDAYNIGGLHNRVLEFSVGYFFGSK